MNKQQSPLIKTVFGPLTLLKKRYIPLLLIYFAYGLQGFSSIALSFWQKEQLGLSAEQLLSIAAWASIPWTAKIIFGQFVDSIKIFGSRRRIYILIGGILMSLGTLLLVGLAGRESWVMWIGDEYQVYLLSSMLTVFGFVIQDVTADTMTTEVVDREVTINGETKARSDEEIQTELATVQVLGRIFLYSAIFMVAKLGGWLAEHLNYTTIFWMQLFIPVISLSGAIFTRLTPIKESDVKPLSPLIFNGSIIFVILTIGIGWLNWAYSQEVIFFLSFFILFFLMRELLKDMPKHTQNMLMLTILGIFFYRITPTVGPALEWWHIDILGFDPLFFGDLAQISAFTGLLVLWLLSDFITKQAIRKTLLILLFIATALFIPDLLLYHNVHQTLGVDARTVALFDAAAESPLLSISMILLLSLIAFHAPPGKRGTWFAIATSILNLSLTGKVLISKYLNQIFVVTREIVDENNVIVEQANYTELGILMITCMTISFFIPLLAILFFIRSNPKHAKQNTTLG